MGHIPGCRRVPSYRCRVGWDASRDARPVLPCPIPSSRTPASRDACVHAGPGGSARCPGTRPARDAFRACSAGSSRASTAVPPPPATPQDMRHPSGALLPHPMISHAPRPPSFREHAGPPPPAPPSSKRRRCRSVGGRGQREAAGAQGGGPRHRAGSAWKGRGASCALVKGPRVAADAGCRVLVGGGGGLDRQRRWEGGEGPPASETGTGKGRVAPKAGHRDRLRGAGRWEGWEGWGGYGARGGDVSDEARMAEGVAGSERGATRNSTRHLRLSWRERGAGSGVRISLSAVSQAAAGRMSRCSLSAGPPRRRATCWSPWSAPCTSGSGTPRSARSATPTGTYSDPPPPPGARAHTSRARAGAPPRGLGAGLLEGRARCCGAGRAAHRISRRPARGGSWPRPTGRRCSGTRTRAGPCGGIVRAAAASNVSRGDTRSPKQPSALAN